MSTIKIFIISALRYIPPLFIVLIPLQAAYGYIFPWSVSSDVLSKYENSLILQIGFNKQTAIYSGEFYEEQSRNYLIINNKLQSKTVSVYSNNLGDFKIDESDGGLLSIMVIYIILIYLFWYFWLKPHNNSFNLDGAKNAPPS